MYYPPLKKESKKNRTRIINGLQRLRLQLKDENFPTKKTSDSLILGTWNIRNFDDDRFNYGPRTTESMYYIAEIISKFDVIAVQEVCEDLWPLNSLMRILSKEYEYIVTDVTHSSLGGNKERLGFIYDKNKVSFKGVAGEIHRSSQEIVDLQGVRRRQTILPDTIRCRIPIRLVQVLFFDGPYLFRFQSGEYPSIQKKGRRDQRCSQLPRQGSQKEQDQPYSGR